MIKLSMSTLFAVLMAVFSACAGEATRDSEVVPSPPAQPVLAKGDRLEIDGYAACEEGRKIIAMAFDFAQGKELTATQTGRFRSELEAGLARIYVGIELLERSYELNGRPLNTRPYTQATKAARVRLLELRQE